MALSCSRKFPWRFYGCRVNLKPKGALGIAENRLSYIIRGHVQPTAREREILKKHFKWIIAGQFCLRRGIHGLV